VTDPALDIAFARLGKRLEVLLRVQQRATVRLVNGQWDVNTTPLTPPDAELGRVAEAVSKRGVGGFSLLGPSIPKDELQQLVRWLASGASGESTPHIERLEGPTPAPWVDTAPASPALSDTSREVMVRYADLVLELREWLETKKTSPQEPLPDVQPTLVALAKAMQTRATRFYGMIPAPDEAALHHQTNMTLLALGFGAELGLSLPRLEVLAMASFFADVGHLGQVATRLPFAQQADSPNAISWVCMALDQLDGVSRTDAGLLSSIVGLARAWETLTSGAPMRQPMTSAQALDELHERFRPELTPLFARFALRHGVRPIGRRWP
jgi:HD-GYP domain-containing protein (c-di-GMP phosphodiesterase class II)